MVGIEKTGMYDLNPKLRMKVYLYTVKKNISIAGPPIFICNKISPEAVMEANKKRIATIEFAWPVSSKAKGTKEMKVYKLSGGAMAHTTHYGPYKSCEPMYLKISAWIKEKDLKSSGSIR